MTAIAVLNNGASTVRIDIVTGGGEYARVSVGADHGLASLIASRSGQNSHGWQTTGDRTTYFDHEFDEYSDHASLHLHLPFERVRAVVHLRATLTSD